MTERQQTPSRSVRLLGSYSFEDGSSVEVRVYGPVDSKDVLWALNNIMELKKRELFGDGDAKLSSTADLAAGWPDPLKEHAA